MTKADVKKIDSTTREISIEVEGERVKNKFEDAFKKISQNAKVPGFRPGHVPRDILEKNYNDAAHELVLQELIPEVYQQVVKDQSLDVVDLPEISDVKLERALLSFKAKVDVSPEIGLKKYKGIKIKYQKIEVGADDLKRNLDALKESRKLDNLDDNFARSIGYPNFAEFQGALERQIYLQKENQQRQKIEHELIEEITKDLDFKLPQAMVKRQLEDMVKQAKVNLAMRGVERQKVEEQEKDLTTRLEPDARAQVKVYLVLADIAKKENIPADEHMPQKVLELLLKEADWS